MKVALKLVFLYTQSKYLKSIILRIMNKFAKYVWEKFSLADDEDEFHEYQSTWLLRFTRRLHQTILFILLKCPPLYEAFVEGRKKRRILKKCIQFSYGISLGILFFLFIIVDLQLDSISAVILGLIICLFLAIGNLISTQVRCISLLLPLRLGSHTGRSVLVGLIIVHLVAGPLVNIFKNLKECVRVIVCQMSMTYSLLSTKYEIMFKPLRKAFSQARGHGDEGKAILKLVDDVMVPLKKEIENDAEVQEMKKENDEIDTAWGDTKRSKDTEERNRVLPSDNMAIRLNKNYNKKLEYRCQSMMSKTFNKCQTLFAPIYKKCTDQIPEFLQSMCQFMSLQYLCNTYALFGSDDLCRSQGIVDANMGSVYLSLQNKTKQLRNDFANTHFKFKRIDVPPEAKETVQNIYDASKTIVNDFRDQRSAIELFTTMMLRVTAFSFLFIILGCNRYISNYLNNVEEDNRYITLYFRQIDYRRHVKGKLTILPYLKENEKRELCDVYDFRLTEDDIGELMHALISTTMLFLFALLLLVIDGILYTLLDDIRIYGRIEYAQIGHHNLELQVQGIGFLTSLLRSIVNSFSVKQTIKRIVTNEECLPRPSKPGLYTFKIIATFVLLYFLAILNAWFLKRMNRYVCSVFFPKAEKKRTIFLYNETLKKRVVFLNYRLDIVREETKKKVSNELNFYTVLKYKHPTFFGWIGRFKSTRRKCLICTNEEPKEGGEYYCTNLHCYVYYCEQCWDFVVKRNCIGCVGYEEKETTPL